MKLRMPNVCIYRNIYRYIKCVTYRRLDIQSSIDCTHTHIYIYIYILISEMYQEFDLRPEND